MFYLPNCALCWWKSHNWGCWCQSLLFCKHFMLRWYENLRCFLCIWQQRCLRDKGIYIKLSPYIVLVLYILSGEMGASTCNILLINGNKKKEASAWHWVVQEILSLFVHFVLSLCFVICFGVLISAKSIIFFVVWNCVSGTKRPPPFVESTCLWLFTLSQTPR